MGNLRKRLEKLESVSKISKKDPYADRPLTFEKDWSSEELALAVKYLQKGEELPDELHAKVKLTRPSGRLVGLSPEGRRKVMEELLAADDDPMDDLEQYREPVGL